MRLLICLLLLSLVALSVQKCCGTSFKCAATKGSCNMFCCNCESCLREKRDISDISGDDSQHRFNLIDADRDGKISMEEIKSIFNVSSHIQEDGKWLAKLDKNGDGFIQPGEFDDDLA